MVPALGFLVPQVQERAKASVCVFKTHSFWGAGGLPARCHSIPGAKAEDKSYSLHVGDIETGISTAV